MILWASSSDSLGPLDMEEADYNPNPLERLTE